MYQQENPHNDAAHVRQPMPGMGGVFAPLAQYPGASYATLLRDKDAAALPIPSLSSALSPAPGRVIVRNSAKETSSSMTAPALPLFSSALLLVDAENNAVVDRRALREMGIAHVRVLTSGVQAAKLLAQQEALLPSLTSPPLPSASASDHMAPEPSPHMQATAAMNAGKNTPPKVDVVFCQPQLADMSAAAWVEMVRSHPRLTGLPIIAVVGNGAEAAKLAALASGFSQLLVRPYSHQSLRQNLQQVHLDCAQKHQNAGQNQLDCGAFEKALHHFERCLVQGGDADQHFQQGLRFLSQRQWDEAIQAFHKAMLKITHKGEAELGLAVAWRGKGDKDKYRHYLSEAGLTFARASKWNKARMAYARLLLVQPNAPSPFLQMAEKHVRAGNFEEAVEALAAGYDMTSPEDISLQLAKACLVTENPAFTMDRVQRALQDSTLSLDADHMGEQIRHCMETVEQATQDRRAEYLRLKAEAAAWAAQHDVVENVVQGSTDLRASSGAWNDTTRTTGIALAEEDNRPAQPDAPLLKAEERVTPQTGLRPLSKDMPLPVLRPLHEDEAQSPFFASFPGLNEVLTVIRVTRKLLK